MRRARETLRLMQPTQRPRHSAIARDRAARLKALVAGSITSLGPLCALGAQRASSEVMAREQVEVTRQEDVLSAGKGGEGLRADSASRWRRSEFDVALPRATTGRSRRSTYSLTFDRGARWPAST
jgi:hypothetical protein